MTKDRQKELFAEQIIEETINGLKSTSELPLPFGFKERVFARLKEQSSKPQIFLLFQKRFAFAGVIALLLVVGFFSIQHIKEETYQKKQFEIETESFIGSALSEIRLNRENEMLSQKSEQIIQNINETYRR